MPLVRCPECESEISNSAKVCPSCGYPIAEKQQLADLARALERESARKSKKKKIIWGVVLALLLMGGISNALKSPEEKAAEAQQKAQKEQERQDKAAVAASVKATVDPCANIKSMADWDKASTLWRITNEQCKPKDEKQTFIVVSAVSLWREFDGNEVAAEKKYLNKRVAVEGVIYKIESSPLGYPEVIFNVASGIQTVKCQFTKKSTDDIANMRKGQKIIVIGTVRSFVLGSMLSIDDCVVGQ